MYTNVYKHVYGDFTKDERYTRTLFVVKQRKETMTDLEYDYVVDLATSQPEQGDLWGISTHRKSSPFGFSVLMTVGTHIL